MRERGISTVPAVLLAALAGLLTATLVMDWMVIDVTVPEEGFRVKVPVPLVMARVATSFVPAEALDEAEIPPEVAAYREPTLAAVRALADCPDATLVKVEAERDVYVEVAKVGDELRIAVDVESEDVMVRCNVPLDGVLEALEEWDWKTADPDLIFAFLAEANNGQLVEVEAEDVRIAINMW